jgi:pentatricopeptide repeat protein
VQYAVKVGDLVLAVDSSLGDRMWPVSTVEGVVSAVTARLPGQQISFRFERPQANLDTHEATLEPVSIKVRKSAGASAVATTAPVVEQEELLKRCREIIRRYATGEQTKDKFVNKYAVPGLVADKVLDALASAGAKVDRVTLSMIMGAFMSCRQPQKAIETFEAVVGMNANGSNSEATAVIEGKANTQILANAEALDVYTASALLKAHAMTGDLASVRRVLAALEGRGGADIDGLEVASWPGTGADSLLKPDTRCYNIAISAAADSKATDGLELALQIFNGMAEPTRNSGVAMQKNLVSYNALINAMTSRGRHEDAIDLFYKMKQAGVKPDKFSYTALVRAVLDEGDVEELLYDMREEGVTPDVITYNTVIKALCEQRKIVGAKKIVTLMERSGVAPDSITYGLLMTGLLQGGSPSAALTLFETACSDQRTAAVTENVYLFTTAISAAAALGDHDRALELVSRMNSMGIVPNLKTMTALVGACLAANKPDLAFDVYKRISNPDGYAMTQGLRAMCQSRNVGEALTLVSGHDVKNRILSGKQVMLAYKSMIESSLERFDYDMARRVVTDLLSKGHIPSKAIYQAIFDSLKLFPKGLGGLPPVVHLTDEAVDKFKFLLFVIDSILARNLPCDGPLYSAILSYGSQLGSLPRKVAQIMVSAKAVGGVSDQGHKIIDETTKDETTSLVSSWEELFLRYDELKSELNSGSAVLPSTTVRVSSRDVPKVLKAEMGLSYAKRKPRSQEV